MESHETVSVVIGYTLEYRDSIRNRNGDCWLHHGVQNGSEFRPTVWSMSSVFVVSVLPRCKAEKVYVYSGGGLNSSMAGFSWSHSVKYHN